MSTILMTDDYNCLWVKQDIIDNEEKQRFLVINGDFDSMSKRFEVFMIRHVSPRRTIVEVSG